MRGSTYYANQLTVRLYSSPVFGTPVSTLSYLDEAGTSTGNVITSATGDKFVELVRLSDKKTLYALVSDVSMNPGGGPGNTLPDVTVKAKKLATTTASVLQTQVKKNPVLAYTSLGLLLIGIGTLAAKLK